MTDPSDLLTHARWLRRLARSLVHEGADDLVQDTWLAALRRPPDTERSPAPWLRTVMTNLVRLRWRGDSHRAQREHAAAQLADDAAPSSDQLLERHELQQLLARLVGELAEPFRSTILLRFGEGLTPTQIARRLDVPAGTVRWRLKEALARLRARLDELHGDRRSWLAALGPLALPRPAAGAPIGALALAAGTIAIVVAVLAGSSSPPSPSRSSPSPTRAAPAARIEPALVPGAVDWLAQDGAPRRGLAGRVVVGNAAAAGATVRLLADPLPARELVTGADGRFDFGELAPRTVIVAATSPGTLAAIRHVDLRDPATPREIELVLDACTTSLHGKVVDSSGTPIAGAEVLREDVIGAETDAAGAYDLCVLPTAALATEVRLVVRAAGFGTHTLLFAPSGRVHHDFVLAPEAVATGRVVDADGPVADARVTVELVGAKAPERPVRLAGATDLDGRFRIAGLPAGEYRVAATSASATVEPVTVAFARGETRELELRAATTGVVRGRVVSRGTPLAGVTVATDDESAVSQLDGTFVLARVPVGEVELATPPYRRTSGAIHVVAGDRNRAELVVEPLATLRGTIRRHGEPVAFARITLNGPSSTSVTADATGRYEARGLEAGTYAAWCDDRRRGAWFAEDAVVVRDGETRDHDVELAWGGTIAGRVVDAHGAPVAGVEVRVAAERTARCTTDERGAFACSGLDGGSYGATVFPGSGAPYPLRLAEPAPPIALRDGDARVDGVRLVVDPALLAIAGVVVDPSGTPVGDVPVRALPLDRKWVNRFRTGPWTLTGPDGRFRITELSDGDYDVEVEVADRADRTRTAAGATNLRLVLARSRCDGAGGHDLPASLIRAARPIVWDRAVELVGWQVPATAALGASVELVLVYRILRPLERDWTIYAHLDAPGQRVNADHEPGLGWCPSSRWQAGETIVDRVTTRFDKPGRYALTVGLFTGRAPDWVNLPLSSAPGEHGARLAEIAVE